MADCDLDDGCYACGGTGHSEECECRGAAWDLADLIGRTCTGCCPNGCRPHGMQAEQDAAARRLGGFLHRQFARPLPEDDFAKE